MPEKKLVVIVARTRMYGGRVCVGALSDSGENLRLMNKDCASDRDHDSPFTVGEQWEIVCAPCGPRRPPHVEDVIVSKATKRSHVDSLPEYILERAALWKGTIDKLFGRKSNSLETVRASSPKGKSQRELPAFGFLLMNSI